MNDEPPTTTFTMVKYRRSFFVLSGIAAVSILVLIGGAVMLAIGITKYNDAKTTTSTSTTKTTSSAAAGTTLSPMGTTSNNPISNSSASNTMPPALTTTLKNNTQSVSSPIIPGSTSNIVPSTTIPLPITTTSPNIVFTTTPSIEIPTTSSSNQPPCIRDIAILIDNSRMVGNLTYFQKQISFITDKLINNWVINPNKTETAAFLYNTGGVTVVGRPFQYYAVQTFIADLKDENQHFTFFQADISFGIYMLQQKLQNRRTNVPMVTILFTYSSGYDDVVSAAATLSTMNTSLIIVAIGPDANPDILSYLSGTIITSNIDYSSDGISDQINEAICQPTSSPKPIPLPTTTTPTMQTTPAPYSPCQKYIAFIIDASNDLLDINFAMQKGAVGLALPQNANHYERIAFGYYSSTANIFDFGRFNNDSDFTNAIASTYQKNASPNITRALQAADIGLTVNGTVDISVIIFITKPDPSDIATAIPYANSLQSKGKFTVVALLNANITLIQQLTPNIVKWSDMGQYNLTTWIPEMENAFGCLTATSSTPSLTSLAATSIAITATTTSPMPVETTTTPPGGIYYPCESNIVITVDVSSSMDNNTFFTEGLYIVMTFIHWNWTHYERIGLMAYATNYQITWPYGSFNESVNNPVLQMSQQAGANNITLGLSTMLSTFTNGTHPIQNSVFFTSNSNHDDITTAQPFATQINQKGPLIIVAYGSGANITELQRLNPAKIVQIINPLDFLQNGYENRTSALEIYSAFRCTLK